MGWRRFIFRSWWDAERRRELESYIDIETDENIARGLTPAEARRAAYRKLGNPTLIREDVYRMNTLTVVDAFWQDLRHAARLLRLNPVFTLVALASLSLGVGANTAIFQLIDAVRLKPLPVADPGALADVRVQDGRPRMGSFTGRRPMLTHAQWTAIRDRQGVFDGMAAWASASFDLAPGGESRFVDGLFVSGGYFDLLGVRAAAGRLLSSGDDVPGCGAPPVVLSHAFWQREFGGQPSAIGRTLRLDGRAFEIAGVVEPGFFGVDVGRGFDVALALCAEALLRPGGSRLAAKDAWFLSVLGRLRPGIEAEQAAAHLEALSPGIFGDTLPETYPADAAAAYLELRLTAVPAATGVSSIRRTYEAPLWALLGTTGLVLLIACANLANLMLARATARQREIAVRLALGASRGRVVRQLMTESLLLALAGAAAGAVVARWMGNYLVSFLSTPDNRLFVALSLDWRVFAFAGALAIATCVLFGLAPALQATHAAPVAAMRSGSRNVTDGRERFGLRRALVALQVALSLVLMVGAILFARSLSNLRSADLGFAPEGLIVAALDLRRTGIPADRLPAVQREIAERVRGMGAVAGAGAVAIVPMSGSSWNQPIFVEGTRQTAFPNLNRVSPGYFDAMKTPLLAGRDFTDADRLGTAPVAIVNESFGRRFFGSTDVLGRSFQIEEAPGRPRPHHLVVGVVRDAKYRLLREEAAAIAYLPAAQEPEPGPYQGLVVRARGTGTAAAIADVREAIHAVHPSIAVRVETMDAQLRDLLLTERLMATLSAFFGGLAALIAMIGLYGVMSYMVTRRRSEIGIRLALGADRRAVVRMVMGESALLVGAGAIAGLAVAVIAARGVSSLLFGLQPADPATLALSALALASVGAAASYLPALRAAGISPMAALREE
jgi:predicted permease